MSILTTGIKRKWKHGHWGKGVKRKARERRDGKRRTTKKAGWPHKF